MWREVCEAELGDGDDPGRVDCAAGRRVEVPGLGSDEQRLGRVERVVGPQLGLVAGRVLGPAAGGLVLDAQWQAAAAVPDQVAADRQALS